MSIEAYFGPGDHDDAWRWGLPDHLNGWFTSEMLGDHYRLEEPEPWHPYDPNRTCGWSPHGVGWPSCDYPLILAERIRRVPEPEPKQPDRRRRRRPIVLTKHAGSKVTRYRVVWDEARQLFHNIELEEES